MNRPIWIPDSYPKFLVSRFEAELENLLEHDSGLQSPSRFQNKRHRKYQDFKSRFGDRSDGDFVKTRLHFMKVSVDLFRILRLVTEKTEAENLVLLSL